MTSRGTLVLGQPGQSRGLDLPVGVAAAGHCRAPAGSSVLSTRTLPRTEHPSTRAVMALTPSATTPALRPPS